jgi:hypothetical protein
MSPLVPVLLSLAAQSPTPPPNLTLFTGAGFETVLAFVHFLAGVTWIGMLYYFNFVHVPFMAEADAAAKPTVILKLLPKALKWFRWGAVFTLLSGLSILVVWIVQQGPQIMGSSKGLGISIGALLGIVMFCNVWLIIWPKQKIVIGSAQAVAGGGQADPRVPEAAARAFMASRTNVLFSIPLLFFMGAPSRLGNFFSGPDGKPAMSTGAPMGIITLIILGFELLAIFGKKGVGPAKMLEKTVAVVHIGLVLALGFYLILDGLL